MNIKKMTSGDICKWIIQNNGPGKIFDPCRISNGTNQGSPAQLFKVPHNLKLYPLHNKNVPRWRDINGGAPILKNELDKLYLSKGEFPDGFDDFGHKIIEMSIGNEYIIRDYASADLSLEEHKNAIKACLFARASLAINAQIKEYGAIGFIENQAKEFGMSYVDVKYDTDCDVRLGIDIQVRDTRDNTEIIRGHCRAGGRSSKFSKDRRNDRHYKWIPGHDVDISFTSYNSNQIQVYPDHSSMIEIEDILLQYNKGLPF